MDNEKNMEMEMAEAMEALTNYGKACYNQGVIDVIIGVAIGTGLALTGFIAKAIYEERKSRKFRQELKKSIDEFCEFMNEEES